MPNQQQGLRPWFLDSVPLIVVFLIAAHVFALISYRKTVSAKKGALKEHLLQYVGNQRKAL